MNKQKYQYQEPLAVTLNGHRIEGQSRAADALEGWVEVVDCYDRGLGTRPIATDWPTRSLITRRLYGDVQIRFRGIPLLRAGVRD